nr:MAG TPA: hypothetical protein [Bacteriophage sp.]
MMSILYTVYIVISMGILSNLTPYTLYIFCAYCTLYTVFSLCYNFYN